MSDIVYVDAKYMFNILLKKAKSEQSRVFETKTRLGPNIPINAYILLFDTFIRILLNWFKFSNSKKYILYLFVKNTDFIKKLDSKFEKIFDIYDGKYLTKNQYLEELTHVLQSFSSGYTSFPQRSKEMFIFANEFFKLDSIEQISNKISNERRNSLIRRLLFLLSAYQYKIHNGEHEYLFNLWAKTCFPVIETNYGKLSDNVMISDKPCKKVNVKIVDIKGVIIQKFSGKTLMKKLTTESKPLIINEDRTFKEVSDLANGKVIKMTDDNLISIVGKFQQCYVWKKRTNVADSLETARSFTICDYNDFYPTFVKVMNIASLKLDTEKALYLKKLLIEKSVD